MIASNQNKQIFLYYIDFLEYTNLRPSQPLPWSFFFFFTPPAAAVELLFLLHLFAQRQRCKQSGRRWWWWLAWTINVYRYSDCCSSRGCPTKSQPLGDHRLLSISVCTIIQCFSGQEWTYPFLFISPSLSPCALWSGLVLCFSLCPAIAVDISPVADRDQPTS